MTSDDILDANNMTMDDARQIQPGDEVIIHVDGIGGARAGAYSPSRTSAPPVSTPRRSPSLTPTPTSTSRSVQSRTVNGNTIARSAGVVVKNNGVKISKLDPHMGPVITAVAAAAKKLGLPTPVITSGNDSTHKQGSLHYRDRALDFRGNNITNAQGLALEREVRRILGSGYDVDFEIFPKRPSNDHLHVEYDPD
jgi:hypothetical protein